jgi:hypothetical protein
MVSDRLCQATTEAGQPCRQPPLSDKQFCFWHEPSNAQEAAEARRLGGLRRRREQTVSGAYDLGGLASVAGIRRLLEIAALDALGLDNSIARARTLIATALAAARLLEVGEFETRLLALEAAVGAGRLAERSVFDAEPEEGAVMFVEEATDGNQEEPAG